MQGFKVIQGLAFLACALVGTAAYAETELSVSPASQSVLFGSTFTVNVDVSNVSDLFAYQFDLQFNPNIIEALTSSEGSFLPQGGSTFFSNGINDNTSGLVAATVGTLFGPINGVSGSGTLASFTFEAIKSGISSLVITGVDMLDSSLSEIGSVTGGGSVSVSRAGGGTMSAPEIDPASAASAATLLLGSLALMGRRGRNSSARSNTIGCRNPSTP